MIFTLPKNKKKENPQMKKLLSVILTLTLILSALAFVGCGGDPTDTTTTTGDNNPPAGNATLKLGLGVYTEVSATNATEDKAGQGQATITAAAVLVDNDGKIVKAFVDCADNKVTYTAEGEAVAVSAFKTKYELGDSYNMVAYGNATQEWYKQADAFCALIAGKTVAEVKALVVNDDKGTQDVINAGCTITIAEMVKAVEKAVANATESNATAADSIKLGVSTSQSTKNAIEDVIGYNQVETTFFAAAVNAEGKVVAASSDCVQVKFTFDATGASTFDATKAVSSKKDLGDSYNMVAYGGATQEWYKQAAAFDAACLGKTVAEIAGLMVNNYGTADLQAAGCTILVDGFVKAASKIG